MNCDLRERDVRARPAELARRHCVGQDPDLGLSEQLEGRSQHQDGRGQDEIAEDLMAELPTGGHQRQAGEAHPSRPDEAGQAPGGVGQPLRARYRSVTARPAWGRPSAARPDMARHSAWMSITRAT